MSSRGFTPPDDFLDPSGSGEEGGFIPLDEPNVVDLTDMEDDGGEPTTKDDEFAKDDAPEQEFDVEEA